MEQETKEQAKARREAEHATNGSRYVRRDGVWWLEQANVPVTRLREYLPTGVAEADNRVAHNQVAAHAEALADALQDLLPILREACDGLGCDHEAGICWCTERAHVRVAEEALVAARGLGALP